MRHHAVDPNNLYGPQICIHWELTCPEHPFLDSECVLICFDQPLTGLLGWYFRVNKNN